jgi:phenylalanyl-tRNA synthetase beta chain
MKLPLNIAKQYTELPEDITEIIDILSNRVGEVESYEDLSKKYENIVVAEIKEKKDHPNADKLGVYMISIGTDELIQVLAGDKNLEVGDKVAYIKPGGIVPNTYKSEPFKIKSVEMRGLKSNGMMCSEKELDIGPNNEKVLVLPKDAPVGKSFADYYELNDTVVEIENKALTNRGDLFGILGLSRELAGAQGISFNSPTWYKEKETELEPKEICLNIDVDNQAEPVCPRYCAIAMSDIENKESPIWLRSILLKSDIKPVNLIVDITNYLMILTGQPLHAFDFDKVIQTDTEQADMGHIVVRTAKSREKIHALDDNIYELNDRHLVIANSQHPIAIAGVIGSRDTEIDKNSKNIILESANFDRYSLRRTSMDLGIVTDASTRFTRAQSPESCMPVIAKAVELIKELANGKIASTLIDSYPNPQEEKIVSIDLEKMRKRIGVDITDKETKTLLENIEYENINIKDNFLTAQVPFFRQDIDIEEDVYEDIIRIYGYDKITPKLPTRKINANFKSETLRLKEEIRNILSNSGSNELISYSFTSAEFLESINQDINNCFRIKNPLSKDLELMRPSVISSLLEKAKLNTEQEIKTFCIYELGISHQKDILNENGLPLEEWKLALLFTDSTNSIGGSPYYEAKRYLEKILKSLKINNIEYTLLADCDYEKFPKWIKILSGSFEPNSSAVVNIKVGETKLKLGILGEISTIVKDNLSLNTYTSGFEINLEKLLSIKGDTVRQVTASKYPYITQDICFVVPNKITYQELYKKVEDTVTNKYIRSEIECIDIYKKEDSNDRNITLRISLSNIEKTLKDKDFQEIRKKLEKKLTKLNISMLQ